MAGWTSAPSLCSSGSDRARLDLTPAELDARIGVGPGAVEAFEAGIAVPTPEVLLRLAAELGWSSAAVAPLLRAVEARTKRLH
jgi:hypothetical protein